MSIERDFDVRFIANLALREKQIQQNYRPVIAVHKWFARRPGTLFRGLLLSEFGDTPIKESFFRANDFKGITIADPFMGGGTPILEANRLGCNVIACDINPMAYWIVRQEIEHIDLAAYRTAAAKLIATLKRDVGALYHTSCLNCGDRDAMVKYFLWVKVLSCQDCDKDIDLFPGYLLAKNKRHPRNVIVCGSCGDLNEVEDRGNPGNCASCGDLLFLSGPAKRKRCSCQNCGTINAYPGAVARLP